MRKTYKITMAEEMLGTWCNNSDVHREFIASKSKDADKVEEELASLPAEDLEKKAVTVFPRENGSPILYDYQVKGFLKNTIGLLIELADKEIKVGKSKLTKFTCKRIVDNYVFVYPRKIVMSNNVSGICTRPLRAETMQGERVSLASSETVPAGTTFQCEIETLHPALDELVIASLNYGEKKGIGQWRNSGKGRFTYEEVK